MRVSDNEIGLIRQCASVFSDYQGPFTLDQFVGHFADYLNRATGITQPEIYDGLKELIGEGIIVKKMTDQGLKYVHYKAAHAFPDFDGNAPKTYFEGKIMKRRFNHNAKIIQELYGRNFSITSLLNENVFTDDNVNFLTTSYIKYVEKDGIKVTDIAKKGGDFESQLKKRRPQLNMGDAIAFLTKLDDLTEKDPEIIAMEDPGSNRQPYDRLASQVAASLSKSNQSSGETQGNAATEEKPSPPKGKGKKPNSKVKAIQEFIDPDEKYTKSNGFWTQKTNDAWYAWCGSSDFYDLLREVSDSKISQENKNKLTRYGANLNKQKAHITAQQAGFTPNLDGVYNFVMALAAGGKVKTLPPGRGPKPEKDSKEDNKVSFKYVESESRVKEAVRKATLVRRRVADKTAAGNLLGKISMSAFKGTTDKGGTEYDTPEAFLNSGTNTADYFYDNGTTRDSGYDLHLRREGDLDDERKIPTFTVFINGQAKLNATIKGYVVVEINGELFAVHKSKINSVLKESNLFMHKGMLLGESRASLYRKRYWGRY